MENLSHVLRTIPLIMKQSPALSSGNVSPQSTSDLADVISLGNMSWSQISANSQLLIDSVDISWPPKIAKRKYCDTASSEPPDRMNTLERRAKL